MSNKTLGGSDKNMNYIAINEQFNEQLRILEMEEIVSYQELTEAIAGISKRLGEVRKEKLDMLDSLENGVSEKLEDVNLEISQLWEKIRELERSRVMIAAHYREQRESLSRRLRFLMNDE
jgi:hypothetical protein